MNKKIAFLTLFLTMLLFGCRSSELGTKTSITETEAAKTASSITIEPSEDQMNESIIIPFSRTFMINHTFYSGPGHFKFAIIDWSGITWSNDGAEPPFTSVPLIVSKGKYTVNLGDPSLEGMTQRLTADAFKNQITFLQIWFSVDEVNWEQLPDQKIAVPDVFKDLEKDNSDSETIVSKKEFPTGIFVHESKKNMTVQFNEDGSYILYLNGLVDATGSYTIDGDQYKEETNYARCKDGSTATYKWSYLGTWLTFELVGEDKCGPRRIDLNGITWIKEDIAIDQ